MGEIEAQAAVAQQQTTTTIESEQPDSRVTNPLPVFIHGKTTVMHPVEDHELRSIGTLTLLGGLFFGLTGYFVSAYQAYSIPLKAVPINLDAQTIAEYKSYVWMSQLGIYICALIALGSCLKVWRNIRRIKKHEGMFAWSEGRLVPVEGSLISRQSAWDKLKLKVRRTIHKWVE